MNRKVLTVALLLVAAFAPLFATADPLAQNLDRRLLPPSGWGAFSPGFPGLALL